MDNYEGMNIVLFTFGLALFCIGIRECRAIRALLRMFNAWAVRTEYWGHLVFGGACGVLVATITYPWSY